MKTNRAPRPAAALAGLLLVAFGMVATAASAATVEPTVETIPIISDWRAISLPLDAFAQSFSDRQIVLKAEYALTKSCMDWFGLAFDAPAWDKSPADAAGEAAGHYRLYGLLDEAHARAMGYHSYGEEVASEAEYAAQVLPDAYYNVVAAKYGGGDYDGKAIPEGGCLGQARRQVEGTTDLSLPDQLAFDAYTASNRDSRVVAAFASWSTCMADAGYQYGSPMQANNDPRWSGERASSEEIAVALADVGCKKATNLTGVRMAVDSAYQQAAITQHRADLDVVRAALGRQVVNASAILERP